MQRKLTCRVVNFDAKSRSIPGKINSWLTEFSPYLERWQDVLAGMRSQDDKFGFAIISVALKELADFAAAESAQIEQDD